MEKNLKIVGWSIAVIGTIIGLYFGFALKVEFDPILDEGVKHPLRWVYGTITIVLSIASGLALAALSEIIATQNYRTHQMNNVSKRLGGLER
jgi:uncharacterized membrane-anchored protein YhcB (DUF1043 family)